MIEVISHEDTMRVHASLYFLICYYFLRLIDINQCQNIGNQYGIDGAKGVSKRCTKFYLFTSNHHIFSTPNSHVFHAHQATEQPTKSAAI